MKEFKSFSRQRAIALVSFLQRYEYFVSMTMHTIDESTVNIYFDSLEEMHDLKNFLNVFLIDAFGVEEKNLSDDKSICYLLRIIFK